MKSSIYTLAVLAPLAAHLTAAVQLGPRSNNARAVGIDTQRKTLSTGDILARDKARLRRRQNTVSTDLENLDTLYFANITLGTPAQQLQMHIDTGSADLWVNVANSTLCQSSSTPCAGGTYDFSASSSSQIVNTEFNISYVDGSGAVGDYVSDTLGFGSVALTGFQFGIGTQSSSQEGVLGIGYQINEVQVNRAQLEPYPNLPAALVNANFINSAAYSLWLNDLDASMGKILFGGVDTAKYSGSLATVPILKTYGLYQTLAIALTGFAISGNTSNSDSLPAGALLDSGSTLTYLPDDIVTDIYNNVGAVYQNNQGAAYAPCRLADTDNTLDYTFSGKTIKVPYNELFLEAGTTSSGQPLQFQNGEDACLFGIAPSLGGQSVLGDTFLRSAYVVYDLANNEISLAQTVFNATASDVREITSGDNGVPGASAVASPVTNVAAPTGAVNGGGATLTVTAGLGNPTGSSDNAADSKQVSVVMTLVAAFAALMLTI